MKSKSIYSAAIANALAFSGPLLAGKGGGKGDQLREHSSD